MNSKGKNEKKNICAVITACKLDNAVSYDQYGVRAKCIWFNRYLGTRLVEEKQSFRLRSLKDMEQAVFSQSTECMKYEGNRPNINTEKLFPQTHNETKKITQTRSGDCPVDKLNGRITIFFCRKLLCVEWYILCATFGTFALINLLLCLPSQVMCRTVYGMILSERETQVDVWLQFSSHHVLRIILSFYLRLRVEVEKSFFGLSYSIQRGQLNTKLIQTIEITITVQMLRVCIVSLFLALHSLCMLQ